MSHVLYKYETAKQVWSPNMEILISCLRWVYLLYWKTWKSFASSSPIVNLSYGIQMTQPLYWWVIHPMTKVFATETSEDKKSLNQVLIWLGHIIGHKENAYNNLDFFFLNMSDFEQI